MAQQVHQQFRRVHEGQFQLPASIGQPFAALGRMPFLARHPRGDLDDAVAAARARYPGVPVFALGESMGGAVVLSGLGSSQPPAVDGVILVAPAVWSRGDMPMLYRVALFLGAHVLPDMILSNSAAGRVKKIVPSDNIPMLIALGKDPLFQKETRTATLYGLVNLMDEARTAPGRCRSRRWRPTC